MMGRLVWGVADGTGRGVVRAGMRALVLVLSSMLSLYLILDGLQNSLEGRSPFLCVVSLRACVSLTQFRGLRTLSAASRFLAGGFTRVIPHSSTTHSRQS